MMLRSTVMPIPGVAKIAVLRANRIGDFVVTLPALAALRAAYPDAEIVLLGRPWHASFLAGRPGPIDRVVAIPPSRGVGEAAEYVEDEAVQAAFFATMLAERFDLALQLHGGGRYSNPFVARLGARLTAGLQAADAPPLDRAVPYVLDQHEIMRFLEVAAIVGAPPVTLEPAIRVTPTDHAEALALLSTDERSLVAIHPGATDPRRRWSPERFATVGAALAHDGARIALIGDESDHVLTGQLALAIGDAATNLTGRLSLGGLLCVLEQCNLVIGNDSGPLHLAGAVGAATVGLYLGRNLFHYGPLTRARHYPLATWRATCPHCGRGADDGGCDHAVSWIDDIAPGAVLDAARELLRREGRSAAIENVALRENVKGLDNVRTVHPTAGRPTPAALRGERNGGGQSGADTALQYRADAADPDRRGN